MAVTRQITCDGCGKAKGEVNHWYMLEIDWDEDQIATWRLWPWDERFVTTFKHLCGQECAVKALSEWMQSKGSDKP